MFNAAMIIPTGIGCEIGGHAGDANPAAKLLTSVCDELIVHPNVVNAADINEMTDNMVYVEGSMLDRFLEREINLEYVKSNKILVAVNGPVKIDTINSIAAARATIGAEIEIVVLKTDLEMIATKKDGIATGRINNESNLINQVKKYDFDALAIQTPITIDKAVAIDYFTNGGINPWGGVEAKLSRIVSKVLNKPVAHAPTESEALKSFNEITDPRSASEMVSISNIHCVLKGLHKAPRIAGGISFNAMKDIDCLISPWGCYGRPHIACKKAGIPIIMVKENKTCLNEPLPDNTIVVENYLEAVGMIQLMKTGMTRESVTRPIGKTIVRL